MYEYIKKKKTTKQNPQKIKSTNYIKSNSGTFYYIDQKDESCQRWIEAQQLKMDSLLLGYQFNTDKKLSE